MKKTYEKTAGFAAELFGDKGVICGYDSESLIMAVTDGNRGIGWDPKNIKTKHKIVTNKNNPMGYLFVRVTDIIKQNE